MSLEKRVDGVSVLDSGIQRKNNGYKVAEGKVDYDGVLMRSIRRKRKARVGAIRSHSHRYWRDSLYRRKNQR